MVKLTPEQVKTKEVLEWKGLHLFHFEESTCSRKVRMVLALKRLDYTPHHVDISVHENVSEFYLGINPRGLVPCLVHDGEVVIESNDIVTYLEEAFPEPRLLDSEAEAAAAKEDGLHMAMRALTFSMKLPPGAGYWSEDVRRTYATLGDKVAGGGQDMKEQFDFWAKYSEGNCVPEALVDEAVVAFRFAFDGLERKLVEGGGDGKFFPPVTAAPTMTDLIWFPTFRRVKHCGYDMARHPRLLAWEAACLACPAFAAEAEQPDVVLAPAIQAYLYLSGSDFESRAERLMSIYA